VTYGLPQWLQRIAAPLSTWEAFEEDLIIAEIDPVADVSRLELAASYEDALEAELLPDAPRGAPQGASRHP
jgi:hypothetical protein